MKITDIRDPNDVTKEVKFGSIKLEVASASGDDYQKQVRDLQAKAIRGELDLTKNPAKLDYMAAAVLIKKWNFEEPVNVKNVCEVFKRLPDLYGAVLRAAQDDRVVAGKLGTNSEPTPNGGTN